VSILASLRLSTRWNEVFYDVCCDRTRRGRCPVNLDDDVAQAIQAFVRGHVGVRAESAAKMTAGAQHAITLRVFGGCDAEHLDAIWRRHLATFGLVGKRSLTRHEDEGALT